MSITVISLSHFSRIDGKCIKPYSIGIKNYKHNPYIFLYLNISNFLKQVVISCLCSAAVYNNWINKAKDFHNSYSYDMLQCHY